MEATAVHGHIKVYKPKSNGRKPVVVGFPGFATAPDEDGRTDTVLRALTEQDIVGIKFTHSSVRKEGSTIIAPFNLADYVGQYAGALDYAAGLDDVDRERVGVIASSMSGAIIAYMLAREYREGRKTEVPIRCIAFTAPVAGWDCLYDVATRAKLARVKDRPEGHLDISTPEEKMGGIARKIPFCDISEFMKLDVLKMLEGGITHQGIEVLTIGGGADTTVDPTSFRPFHECFGGRSGNIFIYEGQPHKLDIELYKKEVLRFFTSHLQ